MPYKVLQWEYKLGIEIKLSHEIEHKLMITVISKMMMQL